MNKKVSICRFCGGKIYWLKDERGQPKPCDVTKKWFISYGSGDAVRMISGYQIHQPTCNARQKIKGGTHQPSDGGDGRDRRNY